VPDEVIAELTFNSNMSSVETLYSILQRLLSTIIANTSNSETSLNIALRILPVIEHLYKAIGKTKVANCNQVPRVFVYFFWWLQFFVALALPLLFARVFPGFWSPLASPLILTLVFVPIRYSYRQTELGVAHEDNNYTTCL
jgi:hypothetical protein